MTKGRSKNKRIGGRGVGMLLRRNMGWKWEQIKIKEEDENEDIMLVKMEKRNTNKVIMIVVAHESSAALAIYCVTDRCKGFIQNLLGC